MPRPKIYSHEKIIETAKNEFLTKGFEKASLRSIASQINMTPSALYKHYKDKEDMFACFVEPAITALKDLTSVHEKLACGSLTKEEIIDYMDKNNTVTIFKDLIYKYKTEFKLILCSSHGTRYENFIDKLVNIETDLSYNVFSNIAKTNNNEIKITKDELHILLSAYFTAIFEPIVHDWPLEKSIHILNTIEQFFIPSWKNIMGL